MTLEQEIRELMSKHSPVNPELFERLIEGSEVAVAADDLLGIMLKQNVLEQAVLRIAMRFDELY